MLWVMGSRTCLRTATAITKLVPGDSREFTPENAALVRVTLQFLLRITILKLVASEQGTATHAEAPGDLTTLVTEGEVRVR